MVTLLLLQVGSFNVLEDINIPIDQGGQTWGSGGGFNGAGYGGGRIIMVTNRTLQLNETSSIVANGSKSRTLQLGGGSGGSILLIAMDMALSGHISVAGGDAFSDNIESGGAGGGGRVAIIVRILS